MVTTPRQGCGNHSLLRPHGPTDQGICTRLLELPDFVGQTFNADLETDHRLRLQPNFVEGKFQVFQAFATIARGIHEQRDIFSLRLTTSSMRNCVGS